MTASQAAKHAGFKSLAQVSRITGVSPQALTSWYNKRRVVFNAMMTGLMFLFPQGKETMESNLSKDDIAEIIHKAVKSILARKHRDDAQSRVFTPWSFPPISIRKRDGPGHFQL